MRALLLGLLIFIAGCEDQPKVEATLHQPRPAKLKTVASSTADQLHEFTGRVEAVTSIDISFEVGGQLKELPIREGQTLPAGALVAAINPKDFELAVREAEVQRQLAAQDLRRKQQVLEDQAIARSTVQDARSFFDLQQVRLEQARERLADTRITAPFEGYVSRRYVENHVIVAPSQPIVRLHDLTELLIIVSIPAQVVATVTADQVTGSWAEFSFAPGRRFELTYRENRGEADTLVQTYEVSFGMENPDDLTLLPGMTALVKLVIRGSDEGTVLLPASALVAAADNSLSVWVYDAGTGMVGRRQVETGPPVRDGVPVIGGLDVGEQVVISGASQLQEGMKIKPFDS